MNKVGYSNTLEHSELNKLSEVSTAGTMPLAVFLKVPYSASLTLLISFLGSVSTRGGVRTFET